MSVRCVQSSSKTDGQQGWKSYEYKYQCLRGHCLFAPHPLHTRLYFASNSFNPTSAMMKVVAITIVLAIVLPAVMATTHTTCYNYFMQKDGCVHSAADARHRCPAPAKEQSVPMKPFALKSRSHKVKRTEETSLARRYDTTNPSFAVAGGNGICGFYDSKTQFGVCLWSGAEQNNPTLETAGWLNGLKTSNCGKRVYIQRKGDPSSVQYVPVLDGCGFNDVQPLPGCFDIAVTISVSCLPNFERTNCTLTHRLRQLFNAFKPSPQEQKDGLLYGGFSWDFDNLHGQSLQQGPV
ncbi:hypothetical protein VP01_2533g4 [Puccinia sorghi]|uniref:Uncharacterized protein n=1 Tax=Puccinia sorghi TaxID=27349 RepID=A0A0L6V604_9BASI|nr:hypothetical protein VP01_2533g4 [Puccinia sorghi]